MTPIARSTSALRRRLRLLVVAVVAVAALALPAHASAVAYVPIWAPGTDGVWGNVAKGSQCYYINGTHCRATQTINYGGYWVSRPGYFPRYSWGYFRPSGGWYWVGPVQSSVQNDTECTTWACDWIKSRGGGWT